MKMSGDKGNFEREWERAFLNSEVPPPPNVWENIESELDSGRKRLFVPWYKVSIAASLLLAASLGLYVGKFSTNEGEEIAYQNTEISEPEHSPGVGNESSVNVNELKGNSIANQDSNTHSNGSVTSKLEDKTLDSDVVGGSESATKSAISATGEASGEYFSSNSSLGKNSSPVSFKDINDEGVAMNLDSGDEVNLVTGNANEILFANNIGVNEPEFVPHPLTEIPEVYRGYDLIKEEDQKKGRMFIAGVNFSAGTFDPNVATASAASPGNGSFLRVAASPQYSAVSDGVQSIYPGYEIQQFEELAPSVAYSYGANIGFAITRRIIVYSGVNYTQANSILNTEPVITHNGRVLAYNFYSENGVNSRDLSADSYDVNNSFEFLSIPIKAGYTLLNKQMNITLLGGVSTEFLLSNSYSSSQSEFSVIEGYLNDGSEEMYNPVYFNGLVGLNIGYTIAERYFIYTEPSVQTAISQFAKEGVNLTSNPSYRMVMFGLSYRF